MDGGKEVLLEGGGWPFVLPCFPQGDTRTGLLVNQQLLHDSSTNCNVSHWNIGLREIAARHAGSFLIRLTHTIIGCRAQRRAMPALSNCAGR